MVVFRETVMQSVLQSGTSWEKKTPIELSFYIWIIEKMRVIRLCGSSTLCHLNRWNSRVVAHLNVCHGNNNRGGLQHCIHEKETAEWRINISLQNCISELYQGQKMRIEQFQSFGQELLSPHLAVIFHILSNLTI